jgi:Glycosyl transferase family 2
MTSDTGGAVMELTILMPCLNEAETVATCVRKARSFLVRHDIQGEVLVADNGSSDGSRELAEQAGARVVAVREKGYGAALLGGIRAARGEYVIMGDADDSYDFTRLIPFLEHLRSGADLVMGNRFKGGIKPGAMPALHRYLGNPVLSYIGRLFFKISVGDFHCGLRGFRRDSLLALDLNAPGMEFASEMVVRATLAGQQVDEVPTVLSPDGRSRPPHLRSWQDGWRHLRFLLLFSPRWLFLVPGVAVLAAGLILTAALLPGPLRVYGVTLDVDTLVTACAMIVIGFQATLCALFSKVHATAEGLLPPDSRIDRVIAAFTLERALRVSGVLGAAGAAGVAAAIVRWYGVTLGHLDYEGSLRLVVPSITALIVSCQNALGAFMLSILGLRRQPRGTPGPGGGRPRGTPGPGGGRPAGIRDDPAFPRDAAPAHAAPHEMASQCAEGLSRQGAGGPPVRPDLLSGAPGET